MITGFSYNTVNGSWYADYDNEKGKTYFKQIYVIANKYFLKMKGNKIFLSEEEIKKFEKVRKLTLLEIEK